MFRVEVRDFANNPKAGVSVALVFGKPGFTPVYGPCPAFPPCPGGPGSPIPAYVVDVPNRRITQNADQHGIAEFSIRMGGTCPDSLVGVYADGVPLAVRALVSPDQSGDLIVDSTDLALLQAKVGTTDLTGDFDGDGIVTAADVALLQAHMGHSCGVATPTVPRTWGRLQLLYR